MKCLRCGVPGKRRVPRSRGGCWYDWDTGLWFDCEGRPCEPPSWNDRAEVLIRLSVRGLCQFCRRTRAEKASAA